MFFCFTQKTAYEMRISDWSSDVCSSDLDPRAAGLLGGHPLPVLPHDALRAEHPGADRHVAPRRLPTGAAGAVQEGGAMKPLHILRDAPPTTALGGPPQDALGVKPPAYRTTATLGTSLAVRFDHRRPSIEKN